MIGFLGFMAFYFLIGTIIYFINDVISIRKFAKVYSHGAAIVSDIYDLRQSRKIMGGCTIDFKIFFAFWPVVLVWLVLKPIIVYINNRDERILDKIKKKHKDANPEKYL